MSRPEIHHNSTFAGHDHVSSTDNICYLRSPERTLDHEPCALPGSFNAEAYRNGTMSRAGGFSDFVEQECSLSVDGTLCIKVKW